jgi:hypothetical protein
MKNFVTFIRDALLIDEKSQTMIGLSQFKEKEKDFSINEKSIRNQDIKLSDLLRRS